MAQAPSGRLAISADLRLKGTDRALFQHVTLATVYASYVAGNGGVVPFSR